MTTKAPEEGKLRVSYNMNMAINAPDLSDYNLMNAKEKLQAELDAGLYDSDDLYTQQLLRMGLCRAFGTSEKRGKHVLVVSTFARCCRT